MKKVAIMVVAVLSITIMITGCGKSDDSSSRVSRKKLLEKANDTAKLIYTSANNELSDLMVTGDISVDVSGTYNYKLTDTDSSDPIQDAVWTALENNKKPHLMVQFIWRLKMVILNLFNGQMMTCLNKSPAIGQFHLIQNI